MNTDNAPDWAGRPADRMLMRQETHEILGCAFEVLNELGHGLNEKCYENALVVEFSLRKITCTQQRQFEVLYKTHKVGLFVRELIAFDKVIVDTKVIERSTDYERGQNAELSWNRETTRRFDPEFQTAEARMGTSRVMTFYPCPSVCIRG